MQIESVEELMNNDNNEFVMLSNGNKKKFPLESLKSLVDIGEEKTSKIKQLLVKAKKELADAKKEVSSIHLSLYHFNSNVH